MIAIVIDTNVFVAAFLRGGKPLAVLHTVQQAKAILMITPALEAEIFEVIQRPKFRQHFEQQGVDPAQLLLDYTQVAQRVMPEHIEPNPIRDEKDLKFLECAVGGNAKYIVTGDADLLTLGEYKSIQIVTPAQFLEIVAIPNRPAGEE